MRYKINLLMKHNKNGNKGFTLIELLVVIAIIAVLSVVVILTLNPAELLRQARDSNRISDMGTIKSAISLFEADVATSSASAIGVYGTVYANSNASILSSTYIGSNSFTAGGWGFTSSSAASSSIRTSTLRTVDGTGWIPVNFNAISSGAPIGGVPVDPTNASGTVYIYVASSTQFKLGAKLESTKYNFNGGGDAVSTDGGNSTTTFESGVNLAL